MYYREDKAGPDPRGRHQRGGRVLLLDRGGDLATARPTWSRVPFYIFYSMFGLQRIGDLAWAAGDQRARGFLLGGTAGRTTLNGEGLQHEDGHSHVLSSVIPNCVSYDPTFGYELAVIIHDGLRRMVTNQEDVFYYITVMNENYAHPGCRPPTRTRGTRSSRACICSSRVRKPTSKTPRVQLLGSGTILREVIAAAELLEKDWGVQRRHLERAQLHRTAPRRPRRRALEPAASGGRRRASPTSSSASKGTQRPGRRRHRLHEDLRRPDPAVRAQGPRRTGCSAPTASAAPTRARSCATSSR